MSENYSSIEDIRRDFGIEEKDLAEIRARLLSLQSPSHPDKNGGEFASDDDKSKFLQIRKAIEYINSQIGNTDLVPISTVTDLARAVTELVQSQTRSGEYRLSDQISGSIQAYRSSLRIPRITLSGISAAIAAIWLFPGTVKDHPVLSGWFDFSTPEQGIIWAYIFFLTASLWAFTWWHEERQRVFKEGLGTEILSRSKVMSGRDTMAT